MGILGTRRRQRAAHRESVNVPCDSVTVHVPQRFSFDNIENDKSGEDHDEVEFVGELFHGKAVFSNLCSWISQCSTGHRAQKVKQKSVDPCRHYRVELRLTWSRSGRWAEEVANIRPIKSRRLRLYLTCIGGYLPLEIRLASSFKLFLLQ